MSDDKKITTFTIKTGVGEFKSFKDLQRYAENQHSVLQLALEDNKKLQEEVAHLKQLLDGMSSTNEALPIIKTPAEAACEIQIKRLEETAIQRELSLEETKKLDLFIKNMRLLQGDSTTIPGKARKKKEQYSEAQLIDIAAKAIQDRDDT